MTAAAESYLIDPGATADAQAMKRKIALALLQQGTDTSPVQHWTQGAARMANAALGAWDMHSLEKEERRTSKEGNEALLGAWDNSMRNGGASQTVAPNVAPSPQSPVAAALTDNKVYSNDEPSPLDNPGGPGAMALGQTMVGQNEKSAALKDYLTTGGQNLDPATRAWCADYVNSTLQQRGMAGTGSPAARSFLNYGQPVDKPQKGDIAVFSRGNDPSRGHVGFYDGEGPNGVRVLGGNQNNAVNYSDYPKDRLLGYRRPGVGGQPQQPQQVASLGGMPSPDSQPAPQQASPVAAALAQTPQGQPAPTQMAQAQPQPNREAIIKMLGNRNTRPLAQKIIQEQISSQFKPQDYDIHHTPDGRIIGTNKKNPNDMRVIAPPGAAEAAIDFNAKKAGAEKRATMEAERAVTAPERQKQEQQVGHIVVQDIDRTIKTMADAKLPTTGAAGQLLSNFGDTAARDVRATLDTVKANAGFAELSKMRQASPTGGALGSVTEREIAILQSTIGNLEQSQSAAQLKFNLRRVKNTYLDIIHGPGNGPAREKLETEGTKGKTKSGVEWSVE